MAPHVPRARCASPFRVVLDAEVDALLTLPARTTEAQRTRAREQVVLAGLPLAESIARRYRGRGADHEDLLQVARLGLVKAAHAYRPKSPAGFSAFARPTIAGEIKHYFRDHAWVVRPPRSLLELQREVAECRRSLAQRHGRAVTDEEVATALGVELQRVRAASLSAAAYRAASDDLLADQEAPDDAFDQVLDRLAVRALLESVDAPDARLLRLRFAEGRSQASIAAELGISQMQVSRLLAALLGRLRTGAAEQRVG